MGDYCTPDRKPPKPHKKRPRRASKAVPYRERFREKVVNDVFIKNHYLNVPSPMPEPQEFGDIRSYERIIDTSGYLQNWTNPISHVKYRGHFKRPSACPGSFCELACDTTALPEIIYAIRHNIPSPPLEILDELTTRAYSHFRSAVEPQVLLLNFILELLESVKGAAEKAVGLKELWEKIRENYKKEFLRLIKKGLSEADASFLAWSFAVKPFLSDFRKIWCSLNAARKRTKWLLDHAGRPVRVRFRLESFWEPEADFEIKLGAGSYYVDGWNPDCPPWEPGCISPRSDPINAEFRLRPDVFKLDFAAQATVIYTLPPFRFAADGSGFSSVWAAMMSLDRPGAAIWEAIPFSFVVDWFTDVGSQLAQWIDNSTKVFPDGEILSMGHSFKLFSIWKLYFTSLPCSIDEELGHGVFKVYQRGPNLPSVADGFAFDLGGLGSPYHLALETALVTQHAKKFAKRRKPRRKRRRVK